MFSSRSNDSHPSFDYFFFGYVSLFVVVSSLFHQQILGSKVILPVVAHTAIIPEFVLH